MGTRCGRQLEKKKFRFCESVDAVAKDGAQTSGKLWETALLRRAQGDAWMLDWSGAQRNPRETSKKACDGLMASGEAPACPRESLSAAQFHFETYDAPDATGQWIVVGKFACLMAKGVTGKPKSWTSSGQLAGRKKLVRGRGLTERGSSLSSKMIVAFGPHFADV